MSRDDAANSAVSVDAQPGLTAGTQKKPATGKRPRSKVELAIVRGGILILFVVMLVELIASRRFQSDFTAAQEALGEGPVTESDIKRLITRYSSVESNGDLKANRLVATREDTYWYRGLLKQRVLYVYYGVVLPSEKEADVLDVTVERTEFSMINRKTSAGSGPAGAGPADAGPADAGPADAGSVGVRDSSATPAVEESVELPAP